MLNCNRAEIRTIGIANYLVAGREVVIVEARLVSYRVWVRGVSSKNRLTSLMSISD